MIVCQFEDGGKGKLRHVCVDTLVLRQGKLLLVQRVNKLLEGGKWGLVGGFVTRDETAKQAVAREVLEETGYTVENIQLLTIRDNPDRPSEDRQNFAFVFFCTAREKVGTSDNESTAQQWFSLDDIPPVAEIAFDHNKNIELYRKYLKEKFSIPALL